MAVVLLLSCGVYASSSENPASGMDEWIISDEAGANGYYEYDLETKEGHFVPPSEIPEADYKAVPAEIPDMEEPNENISPFTVVGDDEREIVTNPTGRFGSTCLIASRFGPNDEDVFMGTGWLVNNSYLVTAGHNLYYDIYDRNQIKDNGNDGYPLHVAVYLAASGGKYKQYRKGHKIDIGKNYRDYHIDSDNYFLFGVRDDWGIVKLDSPFTGSVGHLGWNQVNNASQMTKYKYFTQGYPRDLNIAKGLSWWNYYMYTSSGMIQGDDSMYSVFTNLDTEEGMSGAPIYRYINSTYGYCVEAMHVSGFDEDGMRRYNTAVLLSPTLLAAINNVIN